MNTLYTHTCGVTVTLVKGQTPYGTTKLFVMQAVDCTWVFTAEELCGMGFPIAFVNYSQQHMSKDERGDMAKAVSYALVSALNLAPVN